MKVQYRFDYCFCNSEVQLRLLLCNSFAIGFRRNYLVIKQ